MNRSEIFKQAHKKAKEIVAQVGNYMIALSLSLKEIYKEAKEKVEKTFKISAQQLRETEKAVLVKVSAAYKKSSGTVEMWLPKSGVVSFSKGLLELKGWALWMAKEKVADCLNGIPTRVKFN